jgi:hypothetical protein
MMVFTTNCISSDGESINRMTDAARSITRRTFLRHVAPGALAEIEQSLCYDTGTERGGLRMSNDWAVSYHKSTYRGRPCVYFRHSAIEWIFT